jgi:hypothetical protein
MTSVLRAQTLFRDTWLPEGSLGTADDSILGFTGLGQEWENLWSLSNSRFHVIA